MNEYIMHPDDYVRQAVLWKLLSIDETVNDEGEFPLYIQDAAQGCADELVADWPYGHGFGSSDRSIEVEKFLRESGLPVGFVDGKLTRFQGPRRRHWRGE